MPYLANRSTNECITINMIMDYDIIQFLYRDSDNDYKATYNKVFTQVHPTQNSSPPHRSLSLSLPPQTLLHFRAPSPEHPNLPPHYHSPLLHCWRLQQVAACSAHSAPLAATALWRRRVRTPRHWWWKSPADVARLGRRRQRWWHCRA